MNTHMECTDHTAMHVLFHMARHEKNRIRIVPFWFARLLAALFLCLLRRYILHSFSILRFARPRTTCDIVAFNSIAHFMVPELILYRLVFNFFFVYFVLANHFSKILFVRTFLS